jgi:hypothetical protein
MVKRGAVVEQKKEDPNGKYDYETMCMCGKAI